MSASRLPSYDSTSLSSEERYFEPFCRIVKRRPEQVPQAPGSKKYLNYMEAKSKAMEDLLFVHETVAMKLRAHQALKEEVKTRRFAQMYREYEEKAQVSKMWEAYRVLLERQDTRLALLHILELAELND